MIRTRNALTPAERAEKSARAVERITRSEVFRAARTVMVYDHVGGELSLDSLLTHPAAAGKRLPKQCDPCRVPLYTSCAREDSPSLSAGSILTRFR